MHEMSLIEGVLRILADEARRQNFDRVTKVWLEVGVLSHAEPEALAFCFDAATRGTLAEGAMLEVIRTAGKAWCARCSENVPVRNRYDACPRCGGYQLQVVEGDELRVKELEVV
ncbi:MAG: hydrogenase maturation nickel metallochaperone HypA [Hyphomicrobiales bacterium]|nr:hydrogenase maturation nickel metallochaperone HypA [Hyphomicrobiales bacterium]